MTTEPRSTQRNVNGNGNGKLPHQESADAPKALDLTKIEKSSIEIPLVGITPLICNAWSEKAKAMMRNSETVKRKREARDPDGDFNAARYVMDEEWEGYDGIPATAFKSAIVQAARYFDGVTMKELRQMIFVKGYGPDQLVPILGQDQESPAAPVKREDMVRLATGVADIRWRPQYTPWSILLTVEFITTSITPTSVLRLVDAAGNGGVGEWRPSCPKGYTGTYGRFEVDEESGVVFEGASLS